MVKHLKKKNKPKRVGIAIAALLIIGMLAYLFLVPSDNPQRLDLLAGLQNRMESNLHQGTIATNGFNTHFFESDVNPSNTSVILIHGAGEGAVSWYPVFSQLSAQQTTIAPDVPGYGESDKPDATYDAEFYSRWLEAFMNGKKIQQTDLVGSSQGGAIALEFAILHPDRVRKIVLIDSAGTAPVPPLILAHFALLNTFPTRLLEEYSLSYLVSNASHVDPNWIDYGVQVLRMPGGKNPFWQGKGKAVAVIEPAMMARMQAPALVLWGENDSFFPIMYGQQMANQLPHGRFETIPDAGHLPFFDQPQMVASKINAFLQTNATNASTLSK